MVDNTVIIGAGHAGGRCALLLQHKGYQGNITLIGEEDQPPYERPPLSKDLLTGTGQFEKSLLCPVEGYQEKGITLIRGTTVEGIHRSKKSVSLNDGTSLGYDNLVIATGGACRRLDCEGSDHDLIFQLREIYDCETIRSRLTEGNHLAIVGAGFIGLEVAASAVRLGCKVSIVEFADQVLGRVFPKSISAEVEKIHRHNGVEFYFGNSVEIYSKGHDKIEVNLTSGKTLECDLVVEGIGIMPRVDLARDAGLEIDNGIRANEFCQTSDASIYAIGDCGRSMNTRYEKPMRLESWQNAEQQGNIVASHLVGEAIAWDVVPWFWSDQYQYNIQMTGDVTLGHEWMTRGKLDDGKTIHFCMNDNRIVAGIAIGEGTSAALDLRVTQKLIEQNKLVDRNRLLDQDVKLKFILKS